MRLLQKIKRLANNFIELVRFPSGLIDEFKEPMRVTPGVCSLPLEATGMNRGTCYIGNYKAITYTIFGHKVFVDTRDVAIAPHLLLDGFWELWITKFIRESGIIKEGSTVIEVGSNFGYYTLLFCELVGERGKVIACEANPDVYKLLEKTLFVNGFTGRACLYNRCIADTDDVVDFWIKTDALGGSSVLEMSSNDAEVRQIRIQSTSIDQILESQNIQSIDLLKVDAEGSEGKIILGMRQTLHRMPPKHIILEFIPSRIAATGASPSYALDLLLEAGYKFYKIDFDSSIKPVERDYLLGCETVSDYFLVLGRTN